MKSVLFGRKVGLNEKCPCGSSKKYKKCCLREEPHESSAVEAGLARKEESALEKPREITVDESNLREFLTRDTAAISRKVEEARIKIGKEQVIVFPSFLETGSFLSFRDKNDSVGQKTFVSFMTRAKSDPKCICGSGKRITDCCANLMLEGKAFVLNSDKETYCLYEPKGGRMETTDFQRVRDAFMKNHDFINSEDGSERCFFNYAGENPYVTEFGAGVFGTLEIRRKADGGARVIFEAASKLRHDALRKVIEEIINCCEEEAKLGGFLYKAKNAERKTDSPGALKHIENALKAFPENPVVLNEKARLLAHLGETDAALGICCKLIEKHGEDEAFLANKGFILMIKKRYAEAMECFGKALEKNPCIVPALNNKGQIHMVNGELEKAIECFDKVLKIDNCNFFAAMNKGNALTLQGKDDLAKEYFSRASKANFREFARYVASAFIKKETFINKY